MLRLRRATKFSFFLLEIKKVFLITCVIWEKASPESDEPLPQGVQVSEG
jgi:hypothetical protein